MRMLRRVRNRAGITGGRPRRCSLRCSLHGLRQRAQLGRCSAKRPGDIERIADPGTRTQQGTGRAPPHPPQQCLLRLAHAHRPVTAPGRLRRAALSSALPIDGARDRSGLATRRASLPWRVSSDGTASERNAAKGRAPIAAISLSPRARHLCPTASGGCQPRLKCTSSIEKSVVTTSSSPLRTASTAASSPMPTRSPPLAPRAARARTPFRMSRSSSPIASAYAADARPPASAAAHRYRLRSTQPESAMHPAAQPQGRGWTYSPKQQEAGNGISAITCLSRF